MKTPAISLFALLLSILSSWAAEPVAASDGRVLGAAHFEIDLDSNSLIVTTDEETNETIGKIIAELDQAVPQALIKILFLEVQHGDDLDLGTDISYSHESSNGDKSILNTMFGAA
ncbi:MAG: hypothetical protein KAI66_22790, partial [Lentisphaeria bacterium]|nr:hypothetical protein [Lentisphaeria bacterium]